MGQTPTAAMLYNFCTGLMHPIVSMHDWLYISVAYLQLWSNLKSLPNLSDGDAIARAILIREVDYRV